jgi:RNA polymerase sigma-70 factor (ECF subfamily)
MMIAHDYDRARTLWRRADDSSCDKTQGNEVPVSDTILRAQKGDSSAFERIYQSHCRRIYALCLRMVGNPTEAEDLTQEAFLLVFRKIQTFRGESAFATWLHRLALNVVFMHLRKEKLTGVLLKKTTQPDDKYTVQGKEVGGRDLALTGLLDRFNLERAVNELPETCKMVFVLHDIQGYKHHEIAGIMDSSVGTSKVRLHRARLRLRELLRESRDCLSSGYGAPGQTSQYQASY